MGIYRLSYKNLRRNRWRNFSTIIRIAFGVIILILLLSSGIGLKTFLKEDQSQGSNFLPNNTNKSSNLNLTSEELLTSIGNFVNSTFGLNLTNSQVYRVYKPNFIQCYIYYRYTGQSDIFSRYFWYNLCHGSNLVERRREIALLKLMGFTTFQVAVSHLLEAALLGFIGALVGSIWEYWSFLWRPFFTKIFLFL